ncbi:hypothetical protein HCH_06426 [Hahella chejuensis KCTC 2396]|uniref:Uncharacterized protein n=1 Tax=Hahella chejuensis (strain KCTC 2396) TaxID=349521 RepID=Q2S8F3_HAHCH|nr:hypothetical protein HCH_06426 [Hahella chejuensis KCTC 2396]
MTGIELRHGLLMAGKKLGGILSDIRSLVDNECL